MSDNDLIRRGDALMAAEAEMRRYGFGLPGGRGDQMQIAINAIHAAQPTVSPDVAALVEALREANGTLEDALQEVGDDYPGSNCQAWCQEQVKQARAALARVKGVM